MRITEQILKGRVSDDMTGFVMIILDKGRSQEMHDIFAYILEQMKKLQGIGSLKSHRPKP
jgi:F-type H+-transporting ATPase subunit delta